MLNTSLFPDCRRLISRLALTLAMMLNVVSARAFMTNYFSNFESPAYTAGIGLDNQQGWTGVAWNSTGSTRTNAYNSGNGVVSGGLGGSGQAAYVGLTSMPTGYTGLLDLWKSFPFDPVANGTPVVKFSTKMKIVNSSNGNDDYFFYQFYNTNGAFLFAITFDTYYKEVFSIDANNGFSPTYTTYQSGVEYSLVVTMNFASNTYSATLTNLSTLTGVTFISSLPISVDGSALTIDSVDVVWQAYDSANLGDNQMIFDDYLVTSGPKPVLGVLSAGARQPATVRLTEDDGYKFSLDYATNLAAAVWTPLATNTVSGGHADYLDNGATNSPARYYRARWVP